MMQSVALNGSASDVAAALTGITSYTGTITLTTAASVAEISTINTAIGSTLGTYNSKIYQVIFLVLLQLQPS